MSQENYLPQYYDVDNIVYSDVEYIDSSDNKLTIKIYDRYQGKPLYIQTPELLNLFGVIKKKNYSELLLPLNGIQCLALKNFINKLQNKILNDASYNKKEWFKNNSSVRFIPIIKEINKDATSTIEQLTDINNMDKCDDGLLKIKITESTIIRKENTEVSINELTKNKKVRMIIQIYAIWINNNTFSIYIKPEIIEEKNLFNLSFIEDPILFESDDEKNDSDNDNNSVIYDDKNNEIKYDNDSNNEITNRNIILQSSISDKSSKKSNSNSSRKSKK